MIVTVGLWLWLWLWMVMYQTEEKNDLLAITESMFFLDEQSYASLFLTDSAKKKLLAVTKLLFFSDEQS